MKISLIQICSKLDPNENLEKIQKFIDQAKSENPGVEAIFLPEVFYSMSDATTPTPYLIETGNEHYERIQNLAKSNNVYILGGSAATKENGKIFNRSFNFNPEGELIDYYDKIHLFTIDMKSSDTVLDERNLYDNGNDLKMIDIGDFKLGLTICFDLRFPELFRKLFQKGANIMSVSSAFTVPTGRAHWKTLLTARAIENQSYIIACNQWGRHNDKLNSWGHSIVINPWGEVLAECGEGETVIHAELSLDKINEIRARMDMSTRF